MATITATSFQRPTRTSPSVSVRFATDPALTPSHSLSLSFTSGSHEAFAERIPYREIDSIGDGNFKVTVPAIGFAEESEQETIVTLYVWKGEKLVGEGVEVGRY